MTIRLKTVRPAPTNRYEDRNNWKLVDSKRLLELKPGDVVSTGKGERVEIVSLQPPHKASSQGKVCVTDAGDRVTSMQYYASVIGAHYEYMGDLS